VQIHDSHTTKPLYKGADLLQSPSVFEEKSKIYAELQTTKYFELWGIIA
jgi:hypothetical protein